MTRKQLVFILLFAGLSAVILALDPGRFFSLDYLKSQHAALMTYRTDHAVITALLYFMLYVVVTGLSIPGAVILTLAGGATFGLLWGAVLVSFASTVGATLAFFAARFALRDVVQQRFQYR